MNEMFKSHRDSVTDQVMIKKMIADNKACEPLAQRVSTVSDIVDVSRPKNDVVKTRHGQDSDYSVILTSSGNYSINNVKNEVKNLR